MSRSSKGKFHDQADDECKVNSQAKNASWAATPHLAYCQAGSSIRMATSFFGLIEIDDHI
jgi:hypothetical protein